MLNLNGKFAVLLVRDSITDCVRSRKNKYRSPDGVRPNTREHALIAGFRREFAGI